MDSWNRFTWAVTYRLAHGYPFQLGPYLNLSFTDSGVCCGTRCFACGGWNQHRRNCQRAVE